MAFRVRKAFGTFEKRAPGPLRLAYNRTDYPGCASAAMRKKRANNRASIVCRRSALSFFLSHR